MNPSLFAQIRQAAFSVLALVVCLPAVSRTETVSPVDGPVVFAGVPAPAKENFRIYLLMGQSNMAGRGKLSADREGSNPRVLAMAPDGRWVPAKDPLHEKIGRTEPGVGPGLSFAAEMLKADPNITIGLVPCAVGGSPLRRWTRGGDLYAAAIERARLAAQVGVLSGVLWHQGESDTIKQRDAETYEARLSQMIADLRSDLAAPHLPVVVGQLGDFLTPEKQPHAETVRAALRNIPATLPHTGYADSAGLTDKGDKLHFDTASQTELGARFAKAMQDVH